MDPWWRGSPARSQVINQDINKQISSIYSCRKQSEGYKEVCVCPEKVRSIPSIRDASEAAQVQPAARSGGGVGIWPSGGE